MGLGQFNVRYCLAGVMHRRGASWTHEKVGFATEYGGYTLGAYLLGTSTKFRQ